LSIRKKYYAIFGLSENASKDDIRKAYRKLAMQYHPDKNPDPKAHQVFIDLAEAYEILINDKLPAQESKRSDFRKDKTFEERRKEAEIRFKNQQAREKKEQERYFSNLTNGRKWKIFLRFAQIAAVFSFLLFVDEFLPLHREKHVVTAFSPKYNGLYESQVISFKTDKNIELFVKNPYPSIYTSHPEITIFRSWIFHNPVKILHETPYYKKFFGVDFAVNSLFPAVSLLFLIPILTVYFRRKSFWFTLFYLFSFNLIGVCFLYFVITQDRWLHLLTLGLI
jgi:curved DNA-binding protein CbpA